MSAVPRVVRNDWSQLDVPDLGRWEPSLRVSVVIPAYNCQPSLDLTLASLARQTYPAGLLEVVVVDDGSQPPLTLPEIRPENCRLVRVDDPAAGWGIAYASHLGAQRSSGEVIHRLDADMVVFPDHVEALARWHHLVPYAVTLGYKRFVDVSPGGAGWPSPTEVAKDGDDDAVARLFTESDSEPHDYIEEIIRRTDQLRAGDHLSFLAHVGATVAVRRDLYDAAGGFDPRLRRGSDTEFGYRLAQAGALFVPEPQARSWHLGRSNVMRDAERVQRYSRPFLADLMPLPRWLRKVGGSGWTVPLVDVVVEVDGHPLETVRAAVDAILRSDETDVRVCLAGPWDTLREDRLPVLADPALDLRLIAATYGCDPRVRLVDRAPASAFPSPYRLTVPATIGLARTAIGRMIEAIDHHQAGVLRVLPPGGAGTPVELWRTAAQARAGWSRRDGEPLFDAVLEVYGAQTLPPDEIGLADLSQFSPGQLAEGVALSAAAPQRPGGWLPASVEVAGVRSLARAAVLVARMSARQVSAKAGRLVGRSRKSRHGR